MAAALLAVMERKRQELVRRFGAKIRNERPVSPQEPLPEPIKAKLRTLIAIERQWETSRDKK